MRDIAEDAMWDVVEAAVVEEKDVQAGAEGTVLVEARRTVVANIASPTATVLTPAPCVKPQGPNHITSATFANMQGGSTANCE